MSLFFMGKYINVGNPASTVIIPKNTFILKELYSSKKVRYSYGQY